MRGITVTFSFFTLVKTRIMLISTCLKRRSFFPSVKFHVGGALLFVALCLAVSILKAVLVSLNYAVNFRFDLIVVWLHFHLHLEYNIDLEPLRSIPLCCLRKITFFTSLLFHYLILGKTRG